MSVSLRRRPKRNRVPSVAKLRETVRTGPAAEFYTDGGPTMSLSRIAALPEPEWARPAYASRHGLPLGWLRTVDMVAVASSRATVAENLSAIAGEFGRLGRHTVRMAVAPVVAQLDNGAHSTWDHRPLGVAVGRELGTEDTSAVTR